MDVASALRAFGLALAIGCCAGCQSTGAGVASDSAVEDGPLGTADTTTPAIGPYRRPVIVGGATGTSDNAREIERHLGIE